ncbi:MAG: lysophospholipid acyltransferase family protein [Bacteroidales bacterium]|nr:lysophospholipid acyltransferase family protein [Bacteroidales bacterium]
MITRLLIYWFCYPLALLPMCLLYVLAGPLYLVLNHVIRYRRKVIDENLKNSFPEKSASELRRLRNRYYWHLSQIVVEMIKMLVMSRRNLKRRYHCSNPELVNQYFRQGKSVILMSSHFNNWEWMILALDEMFEHHGVGVGKPNSDKGFEKTVNRARTRYGTEVVFADTVRETFEHYESQHIPAAYMMLSDQSPNSKKRCYVTQFLNQTTGVIFGAEHFARKYNIPVLYYEVIKERMGHYRVDVHVIADNPAEWDEYAITQKYVELLEKTIRRDPPYWLWSHRRWKFHFPFPIPQPINY